MRTVATKVRRRGGLLVLALALAHCGDSSVNFVPGAVDPDPGTFVGTSNNGGVITILVGSVESFTMACGGQTFGGACSPVVQVLDGRAQGTCAGLAFDLTFVSNTSLVIDDVDAGSACDGAGSADRTQTTGPTATPGPTAAPATPTPVATPTGDGATPTAVPTEPPGGATCAAGDMVTVMVDLGTGGIGLAGAQITLDYVPPVSLPGSIDAPSVAERVTILPSVGFTSVNDQDTQPDGVDDRVNVSVVAGAAFAEGPFADVVFDCDVGGTVPTATSFVCNAVGSDEFGGLVATTCTLTVSGP